LNAGAGRSGYPDAFPKTKTPGGFPRPGAVIHGLPWAYSERSQQDRADKYKCCAYREKVETWGKAHDLLPHIEAGLSLAGICYLPSNKVAAAQNKKH
jgi:hypothetical protein